MPVGDLLYTGVKPVVSTALEGSHRLAVGSGSIYTLTTHNYNATARTILLFDSATLPANGGVTPIWAFPIAALSTTPGTVTVSWSDIPLGFVNGLWVCLSTVLTTPFTLTLAGVDGFFSAQVQTG